MRVSTVHRLHHISSISFARASVACSLAHIPFDEHPQSKRVQQILTFLLHPISKLEAGSKWSINFEIRFIFPISADTERGIGIWTKSIPVSLYLQRQTRRMICKMVSEGSIKSKHKLCTIFRSETEKNVRLSYWALGCMSVIPAKAAVIVSRNED